MHRIPAGAAAAAALLKGGRPNKRILVYDCRDEEDVASKVLETRGLDFHGFLQILHKVVWACIFIVLLFLNIF